MRIYRKLYGLAAAVLVVGVALVVLVKLAFRNSAPAPVAANTPVMIAPQEAPAPPVTAPATPAPSAKKSAPAAFHSASLAKNEATGAFSVRLPLFLRELWRYDRPQRRWYRVELSPADGGFLPLESTRLGKVAGESSLAGSLSIDLSKVLAEKPSGLYYMKWTLNGTKGSTLMNAGMKAEDLDTGRPPEGMMKISVFCQGKMASTFIRDPRKYCVVPTKASVPAQAKSSAAQPKQAAARPMRSATPKQSTASTQ